MQLFFYNGRWYILVLVLKLTLVQQRNLRIVRTLASMSFRRSILPATSSGITYFGRPLLFCHSPTFLATRHHADRSDNKPSPPELDLKPQNSEEMNELQKEQAIKDQKKTGKLPKADILEEADLSKAEQRKVNWGILKTLVKYIWPKVPFLSVSDDRTTSASEYVS